MTEKRSTTSQAIENLTQLRDQLALQAHLLRAEAKTRWSELETQWADLQEHLGRAGVAAKDAKPQISAAVDDLIKSLKDGYDQIRKALTG